jgi:hypothetical protein
MVKIVVMAVVCLYLRYDCIENRKGSVSSCANGHSYGMWLLIQGVQLGTFDLIGQITHESNVSCGSTRSESRIILGPVGRHVLSTAKKSRGLYAKPTDIQNVSLS